MSRSPQPIVVTGLGVVSSVGCDVDSFFASLVEGRSGGRDVERFQQEGLRRFNAAIVERQPILDALEPPERELAWASCMAIHAARQALNNAGLPGEVGETPFFAACSIGSPAAVERPGKSWAELDGSDPETLERYAQGTIVAATARALGATREVACLTTTCAAGNYAIGAGLDALRSGRCERVIAGGVEELSTIPYTAFHQIRALGDVCRPFDLRRNGLLFGEGAAFLVLELLDVAMARGAHVHAELLAVGYSNDAHHAVAPQPDGAGAAMALRRVLAEAGVQPAEVGYVNAHGTATALNDEAESKALHAVFGEHAPAVAVSSTKGATGHTMAAASAVEAVATVLAVERGTLPPTTGLEEPDPALGLDFVYGAARTTQVEVAASSAFGFGGNNAVLLVAQPRDTAPPVLQREVYVHGGAALLGDALGLQAVWARYQADESLSGDAMATVEPATILGKKGLRHLDRGALLLACALETDLPQWPDVAADRAGAVIGSAFPAYSSIIGMLRDLQRGGAKQVNPMLVPSATSNIAPSWWLIRRGLTGFNGNLGSGECAGLDAIRLAAMQIRRGRIDRAVAGGLEVHTAELWEALRPAWSIEGPFGEAVAAVTLSVGAKGALARLAGEGCAFDAEAPNAALQQAVARALAMAGVDSVDLALVPSIPPELPAARTKVLAPVTGAILGAGSALCVLLGALHFGEAEARQNTVLAASASHEGYASAVVLQAVPSTSGSR